MTNHREKIINHEPFVETKSMTGVHEKIIKAWKFISYALLVSTLAIAAFAAGTTKTNNWDMDLTVTGSNQAQLGQPLDGINVRMLNRGLDAPNSRLRLIIHAEGNHNLATGDIKIDVKEGNLWKEVQLEAIDNGGLMGAIGESGKPHKEHHTHGGFTIGKKANMVWPLRVTFLLPGRYTLVAAVSPDNGQRHIAQPASLSVEAL